MANVKISDLTAASSLTGTESIEVVQSGSNKQTTLADLPISTATASALSGKSATSHNHSGVYQPASGNLDEYAAVNPTPAGLALLDDADAAAQRTTLGLGDVDNTSDVDKPVSTATQTALDAKRSITGSRELLTAARTYYVRTDGSDSNTGLVDSAGGAFLTIQRGIDVVGGTLDLSIHNVTIQVGDGTYTTPITDKSLATSGGRLIVSGNLTTPANVVISTTSAHCVVHTNVIGVYRYQGVKLTVASGVGHCFRVFGPTALEFGTVDFGSVSGGASYSHIAAYAGAYVQAIAGYTISGGAGAHFYTSSAMIDCRALTITLSGTPAFSTAFMYSEAAGHLWVYSNTYSGSATGKRFNANSNGVIYTAGAAVTAIPGSVDGTQSSGGRFFMTETNVQTPTTGFSITISNGITTQILTPAGALATGTITMPANPYDGQRVSIASTKIVTGLTHSPNSGQTLNGALTTIAADGHATWQYVTATTTWYRVE